MADASLPLGLDRALSLEDGLQLLSSRMFEIDQPTLDALRAAASTADTTDPAAAADLHAWAGHARALLSLPDPDDQEQLAARIVAEGLSVRGTEEAVTLLLGRTTSRRRVTAPKRVIPGLENLAGALSDAFDTRVRLEIGRTKGRIVVEFATQEDLRRLITVMAPSAIDAASASERAAG